MPIETFRASSMREALALVRQRLGAEAVVLGAREVSHRRFPWSPARIETEVTAAAGIEPRSREFAEQARNLGERLKASEPAEAPAALPIPDPSPISEPPALPAADTVHTANVVESCLASPASALPDDLFRMFTRLIDAEVHEEHARNLLFEAQQAGLFLNPSTGSLEEALLPLVESHLRCSGGIALPAGQRRVLALVGPTGVGKTTTIAKLAAGFHLTEKRRVGLITIDTFRVGGVDQMRTYAEVIGLPMRSASTPVELIDALVDFGDCELVLIDTAGRSPRDEQRIQELRDLLSDASIDEIHLVLNLSSSHRSLMSLVDRFRVLRPTHLILSKLDEATGLGALYSAARGIDLPISYYTTGQAVPDDIEPALVPRTARLILGLADLFGSVDCRRILSGARDAPGEAAG